MAGQHPQLSNCLFELRKGAGLTQGELAEKVEVSRKSINKIENGIFVPSTVLALKLAMALKSEVGDLFSLPENEGRQIRRPLPAVTETPKKR